MLSGPSATVDASPTLRALRRGPEREADKRTEKDGREIQIAPETQKLGWYVTLAFACVSASAFGKRHNVVVKQDASHAVHVMCMLPHIIDTESVFHRKINTSPSTIDDKEVLKKFLCNPPVKKIDLHFPLGLEVTARNLKGVTVKDALDAIYKQFKKKVRVTPPTPSDFSCLLGS